MQERIWNGRNIHPTWKIEGNSGRDSKGAGVDAGTLSKGKHPRLDSPVRNTRSVA